MSNLLLSKIGHVISEFPLAFKQTKEVKLFMTLLVKNEEGMLEENLQFHKAMGVDGFIITDNITPQTQLRTLSVNTNKKGGLKK